MAARERGRAGGKSRPPHVAVGYTDRRDLDEFIEGEEGDLVVRGPVHAGGELADAATLGTGVTEGTPCLVVPLIRERMDEIQREVSDVLDRFRTHGAPGRAEGRRETIGETGGSARGTSSGAIRLGTRRPDDGAAG